MSKTTRAQKRDKKEGTLRTAIVDGVIIIKSDPRIARPVQTKEHQRRSNGKKPKIVFA